MGNSTKKRPRCLMGPLRPPSEQSSRPWYAIAPFVSYQRAGSSVAASTAVQSFSKGSATGSLGQKPPLAEWSSRRASLPVSTPPYRVPPRCSISSGDDFARSSKPTVDTQALKMMPSLRTHPLLHPEPHHRSPPLFAGIGKDSRTRTAQGPLRCVAPCNLPIMRTCNALPIVAPLAAFILRTENWIRPQVPHPRAGAPGLCPAWGSEVG